jgi:competence ComEA-like helix-hairpin-helix protein
MRPVGTLRLAIVLLTAAFLLGGAKPEPPKLVNINTANLEELAALPAIGRTRAEMIVRVREQNGPFKSVAELRALPRLSRKQFEQIRKFATVGDPEEKIAPER